LSIQYRFFTIPIKFPNDAESELNNFLRSNKVTNIQRKIIEQGENSFWSLAIEYLSSSKDDTSACPRKRKIDYRDILSPEDFALFIKLREWRKEIAAREAVPVYTIFTQ
jgi:hypothetical protein